MSIGILHDRGRGKAALYCNTTNTAFGPLFEDPDLAECFLGWFHVYGPSTPPAHRPDPRFLDDGVLAQLVSEWRATPPCADCGHPLGEGPAGRLCAHCESAALRRRRKGRIASLLTAPLPDEAPLPDAVAAD
jgi:hypothetical protein